MKICFVCNGNNSRSQIAEELARKLWGDRIFVMSCGVNAADNAMVGENTVAVLQEVGIDIKGKMRQRISRRYVGADICYIAMDSIIQEQLTNLYGIEKDRVSVLGNGIADPKGCGIEVYRECRANIEKHLLELNIAEVS